MAKTFIVAGNWKMHQGLKEAQDYLKIFLDGFIQDTSSRVLIAPPFPLIGPMVEWSLKKGLEIGAQNIYDAAEGAFTGEVAASLVKELGATFVIVGHSERRHLFHEEGDFIGRKAKAALSNQLQPIICIGETLTDRESGQAHQVLQKQLKDVFAGFSREEAVKTIVAYEPVWAIGTGKTATALIAEETHLFCRSVLADLFGEETALQIPLLYGGSVKSDNMADLISQPNIDGVLVGGASLDPLSFLQIIQHTRGT